MMIRNPCPQNPDTTSSADRVTLFVCGDVMTGRGIDQVLPRPSAPVLYEPYVRNAGDYVSLAERANGPIPKPVSPSYIWGDALDELERVSPDVRIINLETSITSSDDYWRDKGINYRMHPANIACIRAAQIDCCALANNHVLDWGYPGLTETLETLKKAKVRSVGAGRNLEEAQAPVVMSAKEKGRVIVFSFGSPTSGIPLDWAATKNRPGINLLEDLSDESVRHIAAKVSKIRQPRDIIIASIHWGYNWGFDISSDQIEFAHKLIDVAGIDLIHGHSSHHVKGIEVYRNKLVLYGCGDFLDDYEGITGYERFRDDLGLMYFASMNTVAGNIVHLKMTPTKIRNFRVNRASRADALWLKETLNREGIVFGTRVIMNENNILTLQWN